MTHPYKARPVAATHTWLTPRYLKEPLGEFDLDPCAAPEPRPWPTAKEMWTLPRDGLAEEWHGRVWLNPPYGRETGKWLTMLSCHGQGTALVFGRTDTLMFRTCVWPSASAVFFIEGRPHFHHRDGSRARGNCGGPLMLIAYGRHDAAMLFASGLRGKYLDL